MSGELLIEHFLQVGRAHLVCQVPVRWMTEKEPPFSFHGMSNVLVTVDVALATINNAHVA